MKIGDFVARVLLLFVIVVALDAYFGWPLGDIWLRLLALALWLLFRFGGSVPPP